MTNERIYILLQKFFHTPLPKKTQTSFRQWFVNGEHQQEKEKAMQKLWEATEALPDESTQRDLLLVNQRIKTQYVLKRKTNLWKSFSRIAAVFLLMLASVGSTYFYMQKQIHNTLEWRESFTAGSERKEVLLSDGTTVWLNAGSTLIYAKEFKGKERSLYLNGEAIFDVAKDPRKPFIVKTNHMDVQALGTVFNVEAYSDSEYTIATLQEGRIRVDIEGEEPVELTADQQIRYHNQTGKMIREAVDAEKVLQWKHGYLNFQKASFDYIIQALERRYDVRINYEGNKFAERSFNIKIYPEEDIYQVLEVLKEMVPGLRYKTNNSIIYIQ